MRILVGLVLMVVGMVVAQPQQMSNLMRKAVTAKWFFNPFLIQLYLSLQFMSTVPRVFPVLI